MASPGERLRFGNDNRYVLVLLQEQWFQWPEHAVFIHGFDLSGHAPLFYDERALFEIWRVSLLGRMGTAFFRLATLYY